MATETENLPDSSIGSRSSNSCGSGCGSCCTPTPNHPASKASTFDASLTADPADPLVTDETFLAKELNELSFEEREKVYDDIHGVTDLVQETPEFIEQICKKLDKELTELPRNRRATLDRAIFLKPSIETDVKFKLLFLRAVDYDAFKAAKRFAKYFEDKVNLFGEDKIVKTITLDDLDEEDMRVFRSGPFIRGPNKDAAGRPVWLTNVPKFDFTLDNPMLRCAWYMMITSLLEDEAAQIKGICSVLYCPSGWNRNFNLSQFWNVMVKGGEMLANLPVRTTCTHFCYDNASMEFVLGGFRKVLGKDVRLRLRAHCGSGVELQYKLMTFGIKFPYLLEDDGKGHDPKVERHHKFTEERFRIEEEIRQQEEQLYRDTINIDNSNQKDKNKKAASKKKLLIPFPNSNDVLVGRGAPYQTYTGNIMLSDIIDEQFLDRYSKATDKFEKSCLHMDVVKAIQELNGGRFVERTSEGWIVVDDKVARKKVNSSFRSKMAKYVPPTIALGQKLKQPFSTLMMPSNTAAIINNHHQQYYHNSNNTGLIPWGLGDGGAFKRARTDPNEGHLPLAQWN